MTDDVELLLATHRGHEPSARALWARHSARLLAFARALVDPADAEDVVQGVFCSLLSIERSRLAAVRDGAAWLAQLTRRGALNHIRSHRRERKRREAIEPASKAAAPDVEGLRGAIDRLPRRLREVVVLKHIGGLTFEQIGVALEMPRETAAGRHRAAMAALRRELGRYDERVPLEVSHAQ